MIHDFANIPRSYDRPVRQVVVAPARSRHRRLWIVVPIFLTALVLWKIQAATVEPEPDFQPGDKEASEYQAAVELEAIEAEHVIAKDDIATIEQNKVVEAFQKKLNSLDKQKAQFGFYDSLPRSAWSVPVQRGVYVTEEDRKRANQKYILQAASVRDAQEAQRLVQRLKQLGLQASYSARDEGGGWYRVNVGPFDNVSRMNKAEDVLVSLRMMPLKRKIP